MTRHERAAGAYLFERIWSHPAAERWEDPPIPTTVRDDADRLVGVRYEDGGEEAYEYDESGQLVAIDEFEGLELKTGYPAYRVDTGGGCALSTTTKGCSASSTSASKWSGSG